MQRNFTGLTVLSIRSPQPIHSSTTLGIMRACLETQKLEQLEARMDEIAHRVARDRTSAARERTSTDEAQRLTN